MTQKQAEVLAFILRYQRTHKGATPSYDDICRHIGIVARSTVSRHVDGLARQGLLRRRYNAKRDIEVIKFPLGVRAPAKRREARA